MIEAYIDESGTHDQAKIIVMAGFLSSYKRWRKFDDKWDAILNPPDEIDPPEKRRVFHATDCLGKDGHGDFAGWSKGDRDRLVDQLVPIAKQRTLLAIATAFAVDDYKRIIPDRIQRKWTHPYYLCMFHLVNSLKVNSHKFTFPSGEKIAFVFAKKPKFEGLLTELYEELKATESLGDIMGKMTLGSPEEDIPIQAADLLCYLTRTLWEKEHYESGSAAYRTQELLRDLLGSKDRVCEPHFLDEAALREFVRVYEETRKELGGDMQFNTPKKGK
ncbi:MAG: DUF3800 domain-containing protein [Candidatus Binataceae bacterium]|jgi:hypothetical protein